jgi:hypothetical protein
MQTPPASTASVSFEPSWKKILAQYKVKNAEKLDQTGAHVTRANSDQGVRQLVARLADTQSRVCSVPKGHENAVIHP